jgi:hypothetical protein
MPGPVVKSVLLASLLGSSLLGTGSAHADGLQVPPGGFTVGLVSANGSGCPAGTTATTISPDQTAFTVTYSDYLAQAGGGVSPVLSRSNCQLTVQVNAPQGFTYAIAEADYRGYADLAPGASGTEQANYYFQGDSRTGAVRHTLPGGFSDDWQATDSTPVSALVWAPCGAIRDLNINTQLIVSPGTAAPGQTSFMTMDSTDGSLSTLYHVSWRQC